MTDRAKPSPMAECLFASLIAAAVAWYLWDATSKSLSIENLIWIAPGTLLAFSALAFAVAPVVRHARVVETFGEGPEEASGCSPLICLFLFVVFIFSMELTGFDLATFLFIALTMSISAKRRWSEVLLTALMGSVAITYGFKELIPYYQFPTLTF